MPEQGLGIGSFLTSKESGCITVSPDLSLILTGCQRAEFCWQRIRVSWVCLTWELTCSFVVSSDRCNWTAAERNSPFLSVLMLSCFCCLSALVSGCHTASQICSLFWPWADCDSVKCIFFHSALWADLTWWVSACLLVLLACTSSGPASF